MTARFFFIVFFQIFVPPKHQLLNCFPLTRFFVFVQLAVEVWAPNSGPRPWLPPSEGCHLVPPSRPLPPPCYPIWWPSPRPLCPQLPSIDQPTWLDLRGLRSCGPPSDQRFGRGTDPLGDRYRGCPLHGSRWAPLAISPLSLMFMNPDSLHTPSFF